MVLRRFGIMLITLVVVSGGAVVVPAERAVAATSVQAAAALSIGEQCEPNDDTIAPILAERCINRRKLKTRGRLSQERLTPGPTCLLARPLGHIYQKRECGGYSGRAAEAIAQSRAIAWLSEQYSVTLIGVSPDVQWEINVGGRYADILYYDRQEPAPTMYLVEAKIYHRSDYKAATLQVALYKQMLEAPPFEYPDVQFGDMTEGELDGYTDTFELDAGGRCPSGARLFEIYDSAMAGPAEPGVLRVTLRKQGRCEDGTSPSGEVKGDGENEDEHQPPFTYPIRPKSPDEGDKSPPYPPALPEDLPATQPASPIYVAAAFACVFLCLDDFDRGVFSIIYRMGLTQLGVDYMYLEALRDFLRSLATKRIYGDPHLNTIDGLSYDLQSVGEFDLASSVRYGMRIQARFVPGEASFSTVQNIAASVRGHRIELRGDGTVLLDGTALTIPTDNMAYLGQNAGLLHISNTYYLVWDGPADRPILSWTPNGTGSTFGLHFPVDGNSDLQGLLGNADGVASNDLKLRNGTQLAATASPSTLHGTYANSWRITDATSLFTYPAGQNTATFTDTGFPATVPTIYNLTATERELATDQCKTAGVAVGPAFDDCVVDMALTANTEFAALAAEAAVAATDPNAATVDASGNLSVDYQANPLPVNFMPSRLTADASATTFAGPTSGRNSTHFYVQQLPPHQTGTVAFDLLAIGDWAADSNTETITVRVGAQPIWTGDPRVLLTPTRSGTLGTGQPYSVYRIQATATDSDSILDVTVDATSVDGLANEAFGIDNVAIHINAIAPQTFTLSSPYNISNGVPAAGAGNIETAVSQDRYTFTTTATKTWLIDWATCPAGALNILWDLLDSGGRVKATGLCSDQQVQNLPAGTYTLAVRGSVGTYSLSIWAVPAPQTFTLASPYAISNGVPAAGAGNLETAASEDQYTFTLPATATNSWYMDWGSCSAGMNGIGWTLYTSGGTMVDLGNCFDGQLTVLPTGTYKLVVRGSGTYTLNSIWAVPPPQTFNLAAPYTISNGVPAAGAGNLETAASEDQYTLTTTATKSWYMDWGTCSAGTNGIGWTLYTSGGIMVDLGNCWDQQVDNLPAGTYKLVVRGWAGTYSLNQMYEVPTPQAFALASPFNISNGVPAAGAGNLETASSEDQYTFSLPATATNSWYMDWGSCSGGIGWTLYTEGGSAIANGDCWDQQVDNLFAGTYKLVVRGWAGTYVVNSIWAVPAPQTFTLAPPYAISNGVPAAGAGNLETAASEDQYTLTTTATKSWYMDWGTCSGGIGWTLYTQGGSAIANGDCWDQQVDNLPAGTYKLVVRGWAGTYAVTIS